MGSEASDTGWQPLRREQRTTAAPPAQQAFVRLAVTHGLATAADAMVTVALAGSLFFSISPHAARGRVALSLLFTVLPFGVVAPFLGPAIDRTRGGRRLMLAGAAGGRVVAALLMARWIKSPLLFPAALALLILSKAHAVAKSSLVPGAVRSADDLVEANGRLAMLSAIVGFAAAAPAAGILKLFGGAWDLRLAAIVYAGAMVSAFRLRPAPPPELAAGPPPENQVSLHRGVILAATSMAVLRGVVGFLTFAVAFDFRRHHAPSWWFGIVLTASLGGSFLGAVIGPRLRTVLSEERILAGTLWVVAGVALVAGWLGSRFGMTLLALTVGISASTARLAFDAIVQRDGAEAARGRTFARFEARFQLAWVGAALIPVVVVIPNKAAAFVLALATGMAGLAYFTGRRALRQGRDGPTILRHRPARPWPAVAGGPGPAPGLPPAAGSGPLLAPGSGPASGPAAGPLSGPRSAPLSGPASGPVSGPVSGPGPRAGEGGIGPGGVQWADDPPANG